MKSYNQDFLNAIEAKTNENCKLQMQNGKYYLKGNLFSNFIIVDVEKYNLSHSDGHNDLKYELTILKDNLFTQKTIHSNLERLKPFKTNGMFIMLNTSKAISLLMEVIDTLTPKKSCITYFAKSGWHEINPNNIVWVASNFSISSDGIDETKKFHLPNVDIATDKSLNSNFCFNKIYHSMKASPSVIPYIFSASILSLLITPLQADGLSDFPILTLTADPESGKTELAKAFGTFLNRWNQKSILHNIIPADEKQISSIQYESIKDCSLILDDIRNVTSYSTKNSIKRNLDKFVRTGYSHSSGFSRMTIITAETDSLSKELSSFKSRTIQINVNNYLKDPKNSSIVRDMQENPTIVSVFFIDFIKWMANKINNKELVSFFKEEREDFFADQPLFSTRLRYNLYSYYFAIKLFFQYGTEKKYLINNSHLVFLNEYYSDLLSRGLMTYYETISPVDLFKEILLHLIESGELRIWTSFQQYSGDISEFLIPTVYDYYGSYFTNISLFNSMPQKVKDQPALIINSTVLFDKINYYIQRLNIEKGTHIQTLTPISVTRKLAAEQIIMKRYRYDGKGKEHFNYSLLYPHLDTNGVILTAHGTLVFNMNHEYCIKIEQLLKGMPKGKSLHAFNYDTDNEFSQLIEKFSYFFV